MKYRKKPVEIEAIQYDGKNGLQVAKELHANNFTIRSDATGDYLEIDTLEGVMRANVCDYIIKGVQGELYPCKPDIFDMTYEKCVKRDNLVNVPLVNLGYSQEIIDFCATLAEDEKCSKCKCDTQRCIEWQNLSKDELESR